MRRRRGPFARARYQSYLRNPTLPSLALWGRPPGTPTSREISLSQGIVGAIVCIETWLAPPRTAAKRICKLLQGAVVPPCPASSIRMRSAERLHCVLHSAEAAFPLSRRSRRPHLSLEYRRPLSRTQVPLPVRAQADGLVQATQENPRTILRSTPSYSGRRISF